MNKQKLISVLQSRIAKRRFYINWAKVHNLTRATNSYLQRTVLEQKQDKQILKQLIVDERELKMLRECAKSLQGRIDTLLGWNK